MFKILPHADFYFGSKYEKTFAANPKSSKQTFDLFHVTITYNVSVRPPCWCIGYFSRTSVLDKSRKSGFFRTTDDVAMA